MNLIISLNELDIISKILDIKDLNFGNFGFLEDKNIIGDEKYKSRLASLIHFVVKWYGKRSLM